MIFTHEKIAHKASCFLWLGDNFKEAKEWLGDEVGDLRKCDELLTFILPKNRIRSERNNNMYEIDPGWWICKDKNGMFEFIHFNQFKYQYQAIKRVE